MKETVIGKVIRPLMGPDKDIWEVQLRGHRYWGEGESDLHILLKKFGTPYEELIESAKKSGTYYERPKQ